MAFNTIQLVHILELQNVPTDWTKYLFILSAVAGVIRWFIETDFFDYQLVYNLIQMVTDNVLDKIDLTRAYINNGFVHTGIHMDIARTFTYLTEYIRGVNRILHVFGIFIDILEELGLPQGRADRLYVALTHAVSELTELNNLLGSQLNLVTI